MDLLPGTRLGDAYTVHGLLGEGGMASVYLVQDDRGALHALKVLRSRSAGVVRRLHREGEVQQRLGHPNVLRVDAVVALADRPALVLEYVPGPDLAQLLAARALGVGEASALAVGLLDGVQYAHDAGVVHRDLKPGNVLLARDGNRIVPKVADFGLVKVLGVDGQTRTGQTLGTPRYMPPEQIDHAARVDARADVFSVGAILYELYCGRPAFPQTHLWALMLAVGSADFTPPDEVADLPAGLGPLIAACLAPAPADRPASCRVVRDGLPDVGPFASATLELVARDVPEPVAPNADMPSTFAATLAPYPSLAEGPPLDVAGLPRERDPFVGRRPDLATLADVLGDGAPLVTVLGAGGSGKTRFVVHFLWSHGAAWTGGVRFVDLSEVRDATGIVAAVATVLDVNLAADDPVDRLGRVLAARRRCLVVLDNFEQVAAHAAATLGRWLEAAPDVQFVVTSRERLDVPGERVLALDPLPPSDARALFERRATDAGAVLGPDDARHVAALVQLLDGLPLAVELAAARARAMSPQLLVARMDRRFRLLRARGRTGRQSAMRAALDWSWDLLAPDERDALGQLAVFEGGFTLDAVESVVELVDDWPEDVVQALVDKSLVQRRGDRLSLLVTVQAYAAERLDASGLQAEAEARHGAWAAAFGTPAALREATLRVDGFRAVAAERDNLVAAARRALARGDAAVAVACSLAVGAVVGRRGLPDVGIDLLASAWALADPSDQARLDIERARLLIGAGRLEDARAAAERAVGAAEPALRVSAYLELTRALQYQFDAGADAALAAADEDQRSADDPYLAARLLAARGNFTSLSGDLPTAVALLEAAVEAFRAVGAEFDLALALGLLGRIQIRGPDPAAAEELCERALAAARAIGDTRLEAEVMVGMGFLYDTRREHERATRTLLDGRAAARAIGDPRLEASATDLLAHTYRRRGNLEEARAQYTAAADLYATLGLEMHAAVARVGLGMVAFTQHRYDDAVALFTAGMAGMGAYETRRAAAQGNRGVAHARAGRPDAARRDLTETIRVHAEAGHSYALLNWWSELAVIEAEAGDHAAADACVAAVLAHCDTYPGFGADALERVAYVHLLRGDLDAAATALDHRDRLLPGGSVPPHRGWLAALRGDRRTAETLIAAWSDSGPGTLEASVVARARAALDTVSHG